MSTQYCCLYNMLIANKYMDETVVLQCRQLVKHDIVFNVSTILIHDTLQKVVVLEWRVWTTMTKRREEKNRI